jgi:hypothetical protein
MRRLHLRGRETILKRLVVHSGPANLGLLMRNLFGKGTPRGLAGAQPAIISAVIAFYTPLVYTSDTAQEVRPPDGSGQDGSNDFRRGVKTASFTSRC